VLRGGSLLDQVMAAAGLRRFDATDDGDGMVEEVLLRAPTLAGCRSENTPPWPHLGDCMPLLPYPLGMPSTAESDAAVAAVRDDRDDTTLHHPLAGDGAGLLSGSRDADVVLVLAPRPPVDAQGYAPRPAPRAVRAAFFEEDLLSSSAGGGGSASGTARAAIAAECTALLQGAYATASPSPSTSAAAATEVVQPWAPRVVGGAAAPTSTDAFHAVCARFGSVPAVRDGGGPPAGVVSADYDSLFAAFKTGCCSPPWAPGAAPALTALLTGSGERLAYAGITVAATAASAAAASPPSAASPTAPRSTPPQPRIQQHPEVVDVCASDWMRDAALAGAQDVLAGAGCRTVVGSWQAFTGHTFSSWSMGGAGARGSGAYALWTPRTRPKPPTGPAFDFGDLWLDSSSGKADEGELARRMFPRIPPPAYTDPSLPEPGVGDDVFLPLFRLRQ
jgi:hypothetical protein